MRPGPRSPRATSTRASVRAIAHIRCADEDETTHFKRSPALSAESLHIPPPPQPPPHTVPCAQSARWADEGEREGDLRDAGGERERRGERGTERAAAAAAAPPASPPRGHRDIGRAVGTSAGGGPPREIAGAPRRVSARRKSTRRRRLAAGRTRARNPNAWRRKTKNIRSAGRGYKGQ